jgi:predicted site-specific integrase-resolvase
MIKVKPTVDPEGLYGVTEAARILGVCRKTMTKYINNGYAHIKVRQIDRRKVMTGEQIINCWKKAYLFE